MPQTRILTNQDGPAVHAFLSRYGYWPAPDPSAFRSGADDLEAAVAAYQRLHGLHETGFLDPETLRWMNTPRCGVADLPTVNFAFAAGASLSPAEGWGTKAITFNADLVTHVPPLGPGVVANAIDDAFATWQVQGLRLSRAPLGMIFVAFRRGSHGDSLAFNGAPGGTLGHAFFPRSPELPGHVHLDADEKWTTVGGAGTADLPTLLLHEIGHALGLPHDPSNHDAVMHERFESGAVRRTLHPSDLAALARIYP